MKTGIYTTIDKENMRMLELISSIKGIKKTHIINEALEYYFNAIKTVPQEFIVKPIHIEKEESEKLTKERNPTKDLIALMNDN